VAFCAHSERQQEGQENSGCQHKRTQKCDKGAYNPADSVHCPLLNIKNGKQTIYKHHMTITLLPNSWFHFENLTPEAETQSQKRTANKGTKKCDGET